MISNFILFSCHQLVCLLVIKHVLILVHQSAFKIFLFYWKLDNIVSYLFCYSLCLYSTKPTYGLRSLKHLNPRLLQSAYYESILDHFHPKSFNCGSWRLIFFSFFYGDEDDVIYRFIVHVVC